MTVDVSPAALTGTLCLFQQASLSRVVTRTMVIMFPQATIVGFRLENKVSLDEQKVHMTLCSVMFISTRSICTVHEISRSYVQILLLYVLCVAMLILYYNSYLEPLVLK